MSGPEPTLAQLTAALDPLCGQLAARARRVLEKHGPLHGPHHAYGVMVEELQEFFDETRKKRELRSLLALKSECLDIATVALRYAAQLDHEMRGRSQPPAASVASVGSSSALVCDECATILARCPEGHWWCPNCERRKT